MNIKTLLQLSKNPHIQLTQEQLAQLEEYRRKQVKHNTRFKKHNPSIKIHSPKLEEEPDEPSK